MQWCILSVWDKKALQYGGLYIARNVAVGVRMFQESLREPDSMIAKYSEDYHLAQLGVFDDENGAVIPCAAPLVLTEATALLPQGGA